MNLPSGSFSVTSNTKGVNFRRKEQVTKPALMFFKPPNSKRTASAESVLLVEAMRNGITAAT